MSNKTSFKPGTQVTYDNGQIVLEGKVVKTDGIETYVDFGKSCMWVVTANLTEK